MRLGPDSPKLNLIESVLSVIFKTDVVKQLAENSRDVLMGVRQGSSLCTKFRLSTLEGTLSSPLPLITLVLCNNAFARMQSLVLTILNLEVNLQK